MINVYKLLLNKIDSSQILLNEPMSKHTTFKVGGKADIFVKIKNVIELKYVLKIAKEENVLITILGNGSNILVKDSGIRGIVVKLDFNKIYLQGKNTLVAEAGALLSKVSRAAYENSLSGLEFAIGIPGTIGGAVKMNSGAYNLSMQDVIIETEILDDNLEVRTLNLKEQNFSYRKSIFQDKEYIVLSTKLKLKEDAKDKIKKIMEENTIKRKEKQPIEFPSAGSIFKRGDNYITAKMIDEAGLKGYTIGDACVSEKHSGFIVNKGNATAKEIVELIEYIKDTIKKKFNIEIELEVEILGED